MCVYYTNYLKGNSWKCQCLLRAYCVRIVCLLCAYCVLILCLLQINKTLLHRSPFWNNENLVPFLLTKIQSHMQSCRSLQSLSVSANVSKVVQNGWWCKEFWKLNKMYLSYLSGEITVLDIDLDLLIKDVFCYSFALCFYITGCPGS